MFSYGKLLSASALVAGLSGTLVVPSSASFASQPAEQAAIETFTEISAPPAVIAPALLVEQPAPAETAPAPGDPEPEAGKSVNGAELDCLTKVMLYEAGNEGRAGQLAVAHVVLNRVRSPKFPDSVCAVIYQRGQFSSIRSFKHARNARWRNAEALARATLAGETDSNVGSALYFHATRVRPAYVRSRTRVAQVGNHIFYR